MDCSGLYFELVAGTAVAYFASTRNEIDGHFYEISPMLFEWNIS